MCTSTGSEVGGYDDHDRNRVVLRGDLTLVGLIVRHEMLHAILRKTRGHPRAAFLEKCADTVLCEAQCVREGGLWPAQDPTARIGPATRLVVRVTSPHDTVSRGDSASIFSATVLATNETGRALVVTLPPSEDAGPPVSFSYRVESLPLTLFFSDRATTPGVVRFAIGETKRFVVDIRASVFVEGRYQFGEFLPMWTR
ncbi:MAG: hypothetical protein H7305_07425 [Gemmatimonadaceae bacterium]|nr:hypothetical protein [Gemmatimonadaceae bacterium]